MGVEIDLLDRRILLELDRNSRQSFSQLAKKLHTSKGVINYRVKQLEARGVIKGYYAIIDTVKLGYYNFRVYLKLREAGGRERKKIMDYLVNSKRTWWVALTTSPYDIAVIFLARNMHEFNGIFNDFLRLFRKNLHSHKVRPYVELRHFYRDYILHDKYMEERGFAIVGDENRVELSPQELMILRELSSNARIGTVALAKKLKISPITAKNAIRKLMRMGVIKGFRILLDYSLLGYGYYWIHIDVSDFEGGKKLEQFVTTFPETVYVNETIGGNDVEFSIQIKEERGVQDILEKIFDRYNDIITDYEYFRILENRKVLYMPQE